LRTMMDQKAWREIENRCIQEEAPPCRARCPIHVDVRSFLREVAAGRWDESLQVLAAMPFPGIVGRICDHPCEETCNRKLRGGAISIGGCERAAVRHRKNFRQRALPARKPERVAVVGGGLSSLTAGLELARKGYSVTLLDAAARLGGNLWDIPESDLPREVLREETRVLEDLGVEVRLSVDADYEGVLDELQRTFDAVYLGIDRGIGFPSLQPLEAAPVNPLTGATTRAGVFAGGAVDSRRRYSPISAVADGRRGAISIDRFLQKVSLTAEREREGPYESKLRTRLEGIASHGAVPKAYPDQGYTDEEAREEAGRCISCECMECVKKCLFMERFKAYPKRYVRQVSNDATLVLGAHGPTRRLVNSCSLCDLCKVVCPNDLSMADVCMEGRRTLVERGKMPASAHEFALDDMTSANGARAALASHEPGKEASRFAFFPGCQLAGIYPEHVSSVYAHLRGHLKGGVGLILRCCGVPAEWAARDGLFRDALEGVERDWNGLGRPAMIVACPTCFRTFGKHLPGMELLSLWQTLVSIQETGGQRQGSDRGRLAIHDPCTARYEKGIQDSIRALLEGLGCEVEELPLSRRETECCGYGGLMSIANPSLAKDAAERRAHLSEADFVTYCAMCRNALAGTGKRVLHVLDMLFNGPGEDPAARKACGWSEKRENRCRLKGRLVKTLWAAGLPRTEEHESILLHLSDEVSERMEERRILREDVQKVIHHAETGGDRFIDQQNGRWLASFKPGHVTYWVEYSREGSGWRVHNAYSHRMDIVRAPGLGESGP